ncbi:MAG: hypothetical protein L0271_13645 [Gemmatimonadetes bacterium]|nr:hypothetical protein [Gemmatimonadota bacterium]
MGALANRALTPLRRRSVLPFGFAAIAHLALSASLGAQVRDTIPRRDTLPAPDTTVAVQDSAVPPPVMIAVPSIDRAGWIHGVWSWDRAALSRESAISVLDLLARIPGVLPLRSGVFLQPEAASAFGAGGARTIVELDGYILDPLVGETLDLSIIELASLASIRVERRMDGLRIRLRTLEPTEANPQSRIEAGLGEPNSTLFRGDLLIPHFIAGPVGLALERSEFEGAGVRQPATASTFWLKWGRIRESWGVQAEWRTHTIDREAGSPLPLSRERSDLAVRARARLVDSLVAEVYAGRSRDSELEIDASKPDSLLAGTERVSTQAGARIGWNRESAGLEASLRYRDGDRLPGIETGVEAGLGFLGRIDLTGGLRHERWDDGVSATSLRLHAVAAPVTQARIFAELTRGEWGAPAYRDSLASTARVHDRSALRFGAQATLLGITAGGAFLRIEADSVTTYALPPDTLFPVVPGSTMTGWDAWGRIPLIGSWLSATGHYSTWVSGNRWAYLPAALGRAALEVYTVPLESGNLEIQAWGEALYRGVMQGPGPAGQGADLPARTILNVHLSLRIIDVHIFARFDDLVGTDAEDVPGLLVRGPRFIYGVKWDFRN